MKTLTIPKKLASQGDLIVMPRKQYEALMKTRKVREFVPTPAQKKALIQAERNLRAGKTMTFQILARRLGLTN